MPSIDKKYINAPVNINVNPIVNIFFLSFILIVILINSNNIHIAHGLNPSIKPNIIAIRLSDASFAFISPISGIL